LAKNKALKHSARATAARVIAEVAQQKRSLNGVLADALNLLPENERSLCQQLCYGVLRWHPTLQALSKQLINKPLKAKDSDIAALLLCGLYQLRDLRIPSHAAISETVNACKTLGKPWATGLINASLRNFQRKQDELEKNIEGNDSAFFAHPDWLIQQFKQDWPEQWQQVVNANNQQPPMMLRVNRQHHSRTAYLDSLNQVGIKASELTSSNEALLLEKPCDVFQLPGFSEGDVSVQDGAAQQVAQLLNLSSGLRILDACAAPGGKTCHILEQHPENEVVALDIDARRLQQIEQNSQRLKLNVKLLSADASDTDTWWDGQLFDRILIDAPCSGTGVIRRHPDIKLLRRAEDITNLATQQQLLLEKLWPLLKPDGLLVYTTCSALKQENEQQIAMFLNQHPEAEEQIPDTPPAQRRSFGYQRLPGDDISDGFYYASLRHR
jgi:16S rRNA (cytosine967-C5)-methyltransferase